MQFQSLPEDGSVEVVCVCAVDGVQVAGGGELGYELAPGNLQDLVGDVPLDHLDKVLHLMPVKLQLAKLHRAAGTFNQCWGKQVPSETAGTVRLSKENMHFLYIFSYTSGTPYHDVVKHSGLLVFASLCNTNLAFSFFLKK